MADPQPTEFLSRAKFNLNPIIGYMEAYTLKAELDYVGCHSLQEFALSCGLDAVDLDDPIDRAVVERTLQAQVTNCRDWFENKLQLTVEATPDRFKIEYGQER